MALRVAFIAESPIRIWGLTSRDRVERTLGVRGLDRTEAVSEALEENDTLLVLRGDHLFDHRIVHHLAAAPGTAFQLPSGERPGTVVAVHVPAGLATRALAVMEDHAALETLAGVHGLNLEALEISFQENLLKSQPPFVLPITAAGRRSLERRLFDAAYKGITDLVTKWVWPVPARWAVRACVRMGIRPNPVTLAGLVLVITAGTLFALGHYGSGLTAAWLMTFLDTVDGKLARVTVTASRFGHYFDHLIDLIHPPIWYILWGMGLAAGSPDGPGFSVQTLAWWIVAGYVAGRLAEGTFQWLLGRFGIFCWRPLDAYFRLVTARRNPCLILLTVSVLADRPAAGLWAVAIWTVSTSIFLMVRLAMAACHRFRHGPLTSWLATAGPGTGHRTLAARLFTRGASA